MTALKFYFHEWSHHFVTQSVTFLSLLAAVSVTSFSLIAYKNGLRMIGSASESAEVIVYLADDVPEASLTALSNELHGDARVSGIETLSKESALEDFKKTIHETSDFSSLEREELLSLMPKSLVLSLNAEAASISAIQELAAALRARPGVENVSYSQSWLEKFALFEKIFRITSILFGILLVLGSLMIIGNSIRSSVFDRRDEIEVHELLGATTGQIRWPFVFSGFLTSSGAALAGIALSFVTVEILKSLVTESDLSVAWMGQLVGLTLIETLAVLGTFTLLGSLGAFLVVRKINSGFAAAEGQRA